MATMTCTKNQETSRIDELPLISTTELEKHGAVRNCSSYWTVINGFVYDVTDWQFSHPGGRTAIEMISGRDGTHIIETYHTMYNKKKVNCVLAHRLRQKMVGKFAPNASEKEYVTNKMGVVRLGQSEFYDTLSKKIELYFEQNSLSYRGNATVYIVAAICVVFLYYLFFILSWFRLPFGLEYVFSFLNACVAVQMGHLMHAGNHFAFSEPWASEMIGYLMNVIGSDKRFWDVKHNISHHILPNIVGVDPDVKSGSPFTRFHEKTPWKWYHKWQFIYVPISLSFIMFEWLLTEIPIIIFIKCGQRYVLNNDKYGQGFHIQWTNVRGTHVFLSKLHQILWRFGLKWYFVAPEWQSNGIMCNLLMFVTMGLGLGGVFILNHIQEGLQNEDIENRHFHEINVLNSSNWSSGSVFWSLWSGGLNHQIEHHLFPAMHTLNYPKIAHIVKQHCKQYGLPYVDQGNLWQAIQNNLRFLYCMGQPPKHTKQL